MMNGITSLNWLSVLAAFVPYFMLGALWFMALFAKPYKVSLGKAGQELQNNKPIFIVGPMLCTLVIVIASAILINTLNLHTIAEAIEFALLIGIGYLVANTLNIAINPNIPRPIMYAAITGSYHLIGITVASIIIVAMR